MGYYSDVAFALTGKTLTQFKKELADLPENTRKEIEPFFTQWADKHLVEENSECWFWKDVKWYTCWVDNFPDIDFADKFMDEADDEEFYFVRTGEDYEDNEIRGLWLDNPFGITLCREIVLDC